MWTRVCILRSTESGFRQHTCDMADEVKIRVDSREFRKATEYLARENNITKTQQINRTMYFAARNTWKVTPAADQQEIRQYFGQTGSKIGRRTKSGEFRAYRQNSRLTFLKNSIAQLMAIKQIRAKGQKITPSRIEATASRIVNKALRGINYFKAGWAMIGRRAARAAGPGIFASFAKMPFIRAKNTYSRATASRDSAELTYATRARPKGTKEKRTFILPEIYQKFRVQFAKSAQSEIDRWRRKTGQQIRKVNR